MCTHHVKDAKSARFSEQNASEGRCEPVIAIDASKRDAFGERLVGMLNSAGLAFMLSIGHRTGLFDTMRSGAWFTSESLALAAGLNERYVREWLGATATGGIVEHDHESNRYRLPAEHAAWLTRGAAMGNMAASMQWMAVLGGVETRVTEAFRHGKGVPYEAYERFHEVMAEESEQTVVGGLHDHILPLIPGLAQQLESGIDVLDVACGAGRAMIELARAFPRSRFVGIDMSHEAIVTARANAAGLANVRFEAVDAADMTEQGVYDLVTAFDAIHDQAKPQRVLDNIARALKPGGVFLMQDIGGSSSVHGNMNAALAPFTYTISCMHCMSVSLAMGGPGLGAAWGREKAREMLLKAGFTRQHMSVLPHDPINEYHVCRLG